jgi:hypothetical protein
LPVIRRYLVPTWYRQLRRLARDHIKSGELPVLVITPKPDNRNIWEARQQVIDEMRNEIDTFESIETDLNNISQENEYSDND